MGIVCDNASVMKTLSKLLKVPMIGSASHNFNLAAEVFLETKESIITKIQAAMVKMRSIKRNGELKKKTQLGTIIRNDTRW